MNQKEGLNLLEFLATGINKEDPAIQAILSDRNGEGAAANELEEVVKFINYYTRTNDVRNHRGRTLEMIAVLFAKLRRRINEKDAVLLRRLLALTYRKGDTIWGNGLNLKNVFETYFSDIMCYVAEKTNKDSILPDSNFNSDDIWHLNGGAVFDYDARFSGLRGLLFDGGTGESCTQIVDRLFFAGKYTFHFMLWGKCGVIIQRGDGKYWNANDQEFSGDVVLEWVDDEVINVFEKPDGWDDAFCFIVLPEDLHTLSIRFVSIEGETAFIDYVRLYLKPLNPSYTLIMQYSGYSITDRTLHIGMDGDEPIPELDYLRESYFDSAFIIGPTGVSHSQAFDSVLDIVRPRGIQAFAEFVEKEKREES
ncbi:MAG: hypothetical protein LBQ89_08280 [Treponema sp.]|jgi:hypothetical protein|nr:hypothetical protein [Treponema sp.]